MMAGREMKSDGSMKQVHVARHLTPEACPVDRSPGKVFLAH
jgi:hypothetical protein